TSVFFFSSRRRHTRFSRDWSSDVCSSDLKRLWDTMHDELAALSDNSLHVVAVDSNHEVPSLQPSVVVRAVQAVLRAARDGIRLQIGRASCRERAAMPPLAGSWTPRPRHHA